jgi:hypothetical protein
MKLLQLKPGHWINPLHINRVIDLGKDGIQVVLSRPLVCDKEPIILNMTIPIFLALFENATEGLPDLPIQE